MHRVHHMTHEREILGQAVPNCEKIFSIYEQHTDLIMKGAREPVFGHKVNVVTGKSNLILDAEVLAGNPADSTLYKATLDRVIEHFGITPRDVVCDGGFASKDNLAHASKKGIWNIVFNKIVGSMQNSTLTKHIETRLKKWRSGIEAVLSNLKRGFHIARCVNSWLGFSFVGWFYCYSLEQIGLLYDIERRIKGLSAAERYTERQAHALPILEGLHRWMQEMLPKELPSSPMGKALQYSLKRWDKLMAYSENGELEIDNNGVENCIRKIALGRKNFLFAGSHKSAANIAMMYSFLGSCTKNGVEPEAWLTQTLQKIPSWHGSTLHELLPNFKG